MASEKAVLNFKYSTFMAMFFVTVALTAMSLTYDLVSFGSFVASGGAIIMPLYYAMQDSIAELYGYNFSRKVIWFYMFCSLFYALIVTIFSHLPSPYFWPHQSNYQAVFGKLLRAYFSGAIAVLIGSFLNVYLLTKWKILAQGRFFWMRSLGSTGLGELVQVTLVVFGLYIGLLPIHNVMQLVLTAYITQVGVYLIISGPTAFFVRVMKVLEGRDVFDYSTNFNPFKL